MRVPQRIWVTQHEKGYVAAVATESSDGTAAGPVNRDTRLLLDGWNSARLEWHRSGSKDTAPDITIPFGYASVCFRQSMAQALFPTSTAGLEFLPATLAGEDWLILHCLRSIDSIDVASSDLWTLDLPTGRTQILNVRWINVVDPAAYELEIFCLRSEPQLPLLCTDVFVDRVRSLGLRGLDFKHVGYIVADASQAVPKPPAPPAPPLKPSKRKPPKLTAGPLPAAEQIEIAEAGATWRKRLRLAADAGAEAILQRLTEEMQTLRPAFQSMSAEERIEASLGLSAILGELLRTACGWSWAELRQGRSNRWIAMLAPSGRHVLPLLPYVQQQMQAEAPTVKLLFNIIVAGNLPAGEPGQLVSVG
jgi:hypothetical protein